MNKEELVQEFSDLVDKMEEFVGGHFERAQYLKNHPFFIDGKVIRFDGSNEGLDIPFKNTVNFYGYKCEVKLHIALTILEKNMKIR